ncbi:hypothetical protein H6P81_005432 [Aristolochia fimbriata]|uniref:tRNA (guanosine(18)-2'-O)-methyltransferase TARBP1 n=1 Tax=Aristolochia fimbriata TaxID=158543 RepID=A0AAV7EUM0_ARIFI|nr:hypothetical protein H6P81_005432 [Aristolochia fimbriata]
MSRSDNESVSNIVASLTKSFERIPPAAVPAVIDLILSSTSIVPSLLFSSLLDAFSSFVKDPDEKINSGPSRYVTSFMTAISHLMKNPRAEADALELFVWKGLLLLLKKINPNDSGLLNHTAELFCDVVMHNHAWDLVESTLVPLFLRLVGLSIGMLQNEESAIYQWSRDPLIQLPKGAAHESNLHQEVMLLASGPVPLSSICYILTSLLVAALQEYEAGRSSQRLQALDSCGSENLVRNMLWDLTHMAFRMLSQCSEHRSCAIHLLLPSILRALSVFPSYEISIYEFSFVFSRDYFFKKIWKSCRSLFALGTRERQSAYSLLSLFLSFHVEDCDETDKRGGEEFDIRAEMEFWEEIRRGLIDKDALVRKQSLHILKLSLGQRETGPDGIVEANVNGKKAQAACGMTKRGRWAEEEARSLGVGQICNTPNLGLNIRQKWEAFILLYEMLDEFGTHLVEAAWDLQISLLLASACNVCVDLASGCIYENQMEILEGLFNWLTVLWERGFSHENPQVRCLIMQSFLDLDWANPQNRAKFVPQTFILGPFIQGLNDVVHHKDFGIKGVYLSKTIEGAARFLRYFSCDLSRRERLGFLCSLASLAKQESFGRIGLMTLAVCIASASGGIDIHYEVESQCTENCSLPESDPVHLPNDSADLLDALRVVVERSKHHFNPNYRLRVCDQVVEAAASVTCAFKVQPDVLLHFISALPREFTDYGGPLRVKVKQWFLRRKTKHYSFDPNSTELRGLETLHDFPRRFVTNNCPSDAVVCYDDDDVEMWGSEAQRWARMLFLVNEEEDHIESVMRFIRQFGFNFCTQSRSTNLVPHKFIILILNLIQELQIERDRCICYAADGVKKVEAGANCKPDQSSFSAFLSQFEQSTSSVVLLEELLSFARSSCSAFWSCPVSEDRLIPSSVRGKLGGPSQRRLPSSLTTSVLLAILSMRTVACLSSWCAQIKASDLPVSALSLLWNFCWRVVSSPKCDSETSAEISLATYEALAPVLKAISTTFSSLDFELIVINNTSVPVNGESRALLDSFVLCYLQNINDLLDAGLLKRSRRAILMNWKWLCLDSLLSIPSSAIRNGVCLENMKPLFSNAALSSTLVDLVESLENAGEASVLPMLRCLRLVIELLCSGNLNTNSTSSCNISVETMLNLVQASWILHVNCNKRRVAPIAALLSSILHFCLFNDPDMHERTDGQPGPLKWFIEKILEEGTKSPRTIRLAALHLTGLWFFYPSTIKYYIKELKLLSLYGSVAFDEDFEAELSENHAAREEVSLLAHCPDHELTEVFLNTEMYARVSVAVLFKNLADLADKFRCEKGNEVVEAAVLCGKLFLVELLDAAVNDKELSKELYKKYSAIHRRKVRLWQMICVLSRFISEDIIPQVSSGLHTCLYRNNLPAVRQYLETFAIQFYLKFPSLISEQLVPIFHDYNMRPQALSSYVFIAANVILHAPGLALQLKSLDELLPPIIPFLTSHHHSLRAFTQLLVHLVLSKLVPSLDQENSEAKSLEKSWLMDLRSYLLQNPDCMRLRASMEGILDQFNPKISATPTGIFTVKDEERTFECVPTSLMDHVNTFLNDVREDLRSSMAKDAMTIKNENIATQTTFQEKPFPFTANGESLAQGDLHLDFQKKIRLNKHEMQSADTGHLLGNEKFHDSLRELEKEDLLLSSMVQARSIVMEKLRETRQPLILVASLLERIPNLAGLARTCEVFKAAGLAVADASIVQDKQFQLISVTAEKWVPVIEVPVDSMKIFLEKKKQEGFAILGLEQTANSTPLDKFCFPTNTVLVLGREKEGIPVDIIHILDACIEIPQLGVVRSLNVHVSGAIALWEYTRQQRLKQG